MERDEAAKWDSRDGVVAAAGASAVQTSVLRARCEADNADDRSLGQPESTSRAAARTTKLASHAVPQLAMVDAVTRGSPARPLVPVALPLHGGSMVFH